MTEIEFLAHPTVSKDIDLFISIAGSFSPSSTFKKAYTMSYIRGYNSIIALNIAKATRKLAKVRRDYGEIAFKNKVAELKQLATYLLKAQNPPPTLHKMPYYVRVPVSSSNINKAINGELYKFGKYGRIGKYIQNTINSKLDFKIESNDNLPLNIFYACYLLDKTKNYEPTPIVREIIDRIENDTELQSITIGDKVMSILFTVSLLNNLKEELKDKGYIRSCSKDENYDSSDTELKQIVHTTLTNSIEVTKKMDKIYDSIVSVFGRGAGKEASKIIFDKEIQYINIDLKRLEELIKEMDITLENINREQNEKLGELYGVSIGSDLEKVIEESIAMPEDLFYYYYVTGQLRQYEFKVSKKPEKILVLVDKSDSMNEGNKLVFSKSVAILIAKKYISKGGEAYLLFFDTDVYPVRPISLKRDKVRFIRELLTIKNSGGTSIDHALKYVDNLDIDINKVLIITDGQDTVEKRKYKFKIYSIFVSGFNKSLSEISEKSFKIDSDLKEILSI